MGSMHGGVTKNEMAKNNTPSKQLVNTHQHDRTCWWVSVTSATNLSTFDDCGSYSGLNG